MRYLATITLAALLTACGGGDYDNTPRPTDSTPQPERCAPGQANCK